MTGDPKRPSPCTRQPLMRAPSSMRDPSYSEVFDAEAAIRAIRSNEFVSDHKQTAIVVVTSHVSSNQTATFKLNNNK